MRANDRTVAVPEGFERVRVNPETWLLLPLKTAAEVREAAQRSAWSEEDRRANDARWRQAEVEKAEKKKSADAARKLHDRRAALRAKPKAGSYRVLPQLLELASQLTDPHAMERSADKDVNQRRRRLLERLVELGPDRRIALPENWRTVVDDLEMTLPHFRAPIRTLRHSLALADATGTPPRVPPLLLLGPPGLGKTYFSHRVAEMFGSTHSSIQFDQPSAGTALRGTDKHWGNTESGLLFNAICLGKVANPVILLDEMDKATSSSGQHQIDPLAQLHGALERETSQRLLDVSVDVSFDASLTVYIGTANSLRGIGSPLTSRMEVFVIGPPDKWEAIELARRISSRVLQGLKLEGRVEFDYRSLCLLSHLSPRRMTRSAEQAIAAAVADQRAKIGEDDLWSEVDGGPASDLH